MLSLRVPLSSAIKHDRKMFFREFDYRNNQTQSKSNGPTIRKLMGGGGDGAGEVPKNIRAREN